MKKVISQKLKEKKAITLIALVVTIIVLIIIAGVSISLILGNNGIINKSKTAKEEYENVQDYEIVEIGKTSNEIDSYLQSTREEGNTDNRKAEIAYNIAHPNLWEAGVEQSFGDDLYGIRLEGTYNRTANGSNVVKTIFLYYNVTNGTVKNLINGGGSVMSGGGSNCFLMGTGQESDTAGTSDIFYEPTNNRIGFRKASNGASRTNMTYDVWVLYTKQQSE